MYYRAQKGFTLAEVLASVFLLALGLIGAAGMQLHALRTTQQSAFQTVALSLATEMADMMRMTLSSADSHALLKPYLQVDFRSGEQFLNQTATCFRFACDTGQLVDFNIEQWKKRIEASLPGARAKVCVDAQSWNGKTAGPNWACRALSYQGKETGAIVVKIGWPDKNARLNPHNTGKQPGEFPPRFVMTVAPYVQLTGQLTPCRPLPATRCLPRRQA